MQLNPTVFHQPWWMDIVSDGLGQEVVVLSGGMVVARLPYVFQKRFGGLTVIGMPSLSHVLGPAFYYSPASNIGTTTVRQFELIGELLAQLPKASHISFRLPAGHTEPLAFATAGFSCDAEFTVLIKPATRETLWRHMRGKTRNVIRRAEERLTVSEMFDPDVFLDFYEGNLREKGVHNRYNRRIVRSLILECLKRNAGRLLAAVDATGMHAAIFTVWDDNMEYYFMSSRRSDALNGAVNLLIWEALQTASKAGRTFDMDGLHIVGKRIPNLLLLTGFGGTIVPRYYVRRTKPIVELGNALSQFLKAQAGLGQ